MIDTFRDNKSELVRKNVVDEYIEKIRPDELEAYRNPVWIPTGKEQGNWYQSRGNGWVTNRTKEIYDVILFPDEFKFVEPRPENLPIGVCTPTIRNKDEQRTLEGWSREDFFGPGRVVLDLGSGEALGILGYSKEFPKTTFIGVDSGYRDSPEIDFNKKGVQLVNDDWDKLNSFPDNSVDTIMSVQGGLTWAIERKMENGKVKDVDFLSSITRVAKEGCVFLTDSLYPADLNEDEVPKYQKKDSGEEVLKMFKKYGWERVVLDKTAFFILTKKK